MFASAWMIRTNGVSLHFTFCERTNEWQRESLTKAGHRICLQRSATSTGLACDWYVVDARGTCITHRVRHISRAMACRDIAFCIVTGCTVPVLPDMVAHVGAPAVSLL